ncbi:MAG: nucleotide disphospho-sugar-binding domain-containing protein [Pyrinomonadaceae bacterium]
MSKIVLATFGSLGDLHPMIALGLELKGRGHHIKFASMEFYREKIESIGFEYASMSPHLSPNDIANMPELVDARKGTERILRDIIIAGVPEMYDDLLAAVAGCDVLITGEIIYAAKSVVEKTGIKWVTTTLAPISLFSVYDPPVPPTAMWFEKLRFLGPGFHRLLFGLIKRSMKSWLEKYRAFRLNLGLDPDDDPIFYGKFSKDLHLIMFSRALGTPQPDWPVTAVQTGFCFYDGQSDTGQMPDDLTAFLDAGDPPIVFTLGSAAVMDPRDFFTESVKAAKMLKRRAVLLYGIFGEPPPGLTEDIVAFQYAPYSLLFPRAACVVHQAGVGTTGQVLRAGVPHVIVPFAHDQPDNAARCRRIGVAQVISRDNYNAESAQLTIARVLGDETYSINAAKYAEIVRSEQGSSAAAHEIEKML